MVNRCKLNNNITILLFSHINREILLIIMMFFYFKSLMA